MKTALVMAALAAIGVGSLATRASALDNTTYALYSVGKSSDDSWDRCDDDWNKIPKSFSFGGGRDDDEDDDDKKKKKCHSKKHYGNNGWGNGGDDRNPGSYNGATAETKTDSTIR